MKKRTRNITVDDEKYVYWYDLCDEATFIYLSPANDRTIRVCYCFENNTGIPHADGAWFWRMTQIKAKKAGEIEVVEIVLPKFIAQLIQLSNVEYPKLFRERNKRTDIRNAYFLLEKLGYEELEPVWTASLW